jgi:hypothetical protein
MTTETDQNQEKKRIKEERERVYLLDLTFFLCVDVFWWMMPIAPALPRPRCNNYTRTDVEKGGR